MIPANNQAINFYRHVALNKHKYQQSPEKVSETSAVRKHAFIVHVQYGVWHWPIACGRPKHTLSTVEAILSESDGMRVYLPNIELLREAVQRSMRWVAKAEGMLHSPHPTLEQLKNMNAKAKILPVRLDLLPQVSLS